ncbi:hypothetical protein SAMN05216518_14215 [Bacteroidales bacterium KHT7]|nr:hypothetical protein SAMN05216518_14215 [Bacteroidales bacterium KHT7]
METRICISIVFYLKPKIPFYLLLCVTIFIQINFNCNKPNLLQLRLYSVKNYSNLILFAGKILETMYDGAISTTIEITNVPTFNSKISGIFMIIGTLST